MRLLLFNHEFPPVGGGGGHVTAHLAKEYAARGNYRFPVASSMRLTTDLMAWCAEEVPTWNTISISGYHMQEAGATADLELAYTLADGVEYVRAGVAALSDDLDGVVICLGDMPLVSSDDINKLIRAFDPIEGRAICVPVSGRKRGNPVLWAKSFLAEMAAVSGDVGARHILEQHADQVFEVPVTGEGVLMDIDTPERLAELRARE